MESPDERCKVSSPFPRAAVSGAIPRSPLALTEIPPSSFCEEDYLITRYIAEFINTLTNLTYGMFLKQERPPGPSGQQVVPWVHPTRLPPFP